MKKRWIWFGATTAVLLLISACGRESADDSSKKSDHQTDALVVDTRYGPVKGRKKADVISFKGIPFAAPPVEELRFLPPETPEKWTKTLDCTEFRPSAIQVAKKEDGITYDEDCLYLNLWKPAKPKKEKLPVLVFIHGGAYTQGSPAKTMYDGTRFAKDNVIQINIPYRLSALGNLAFPEVTEKYGNVGNLGTLDQIKALEWVKKNVAAFGGDPENITISGESAGAFSVSNLVMSPLAKGLFQRAILESGGIVGQPMVVPKSTGDKQQALANAELFRKHLQVGTLEEAQQLDAQLLAEESQFSIDITKPTDYNLWPTFDGKVIPENPYEALQKGDYNSVDLLAGYNTDEGTLFVPEGISEAEYQRTIRLTFGDQAEEVLAKYPVDETHNATQRARDIFYYAMRLGSESFANEMAKQGKNVYYYNFDLNMPKLNEQGLGTAHAMELFFVFDTIPEEVELTTEKEQFKEDLHNRWLNFIVSGDPNQGEKTSIEWPKYSEEEQEILVLNEDTQVRERPNQADVDFFLNKFW
ncbi:carboxylesterase/lipase family protein [Enterococcus malodoratus]|uniref:Carboxylic ester hydrolase n=1 Tax=Enterococcus malodoratus ATCC 43197 TaxID=1158601 RepID=R2NLP1_9ENTE|nr:carboxylesterase family protein [Enterococcus malodoratus]EOH71898.1 hypothetical protein UAI_04182 [Enterococcus malodoratus ATCC 43197]EOT70078.1 hypothetical protein I585_01557 [Enterococcus malodoratus ATCC 43197]OJG66281.1 hypothetical protein RV07_GL000074 [Enterococcus malodoratus]SPW74799.1 Para-nitrobenzyl esterase [Enterococcus malodoratus]STD65289.1 Para-nitrobenzyl esterase [Enterococcus malodoratus]